jgi:hypothetical protein
MKYLASSFSLQMVPQGATLEIEANPIIFEIGYHGGQHAGKCWLDDAVSIVGHEGTAKALSLLLDRDILVNRQAISLVPDDILYVAQPTGNRITYGQEIDYPELSFFKITFHKCNIRDFDDYAVASECVTRDLNLSEILTEWE